MIPLSLNTVLITSRSFYSANHPNITSFIELSDGCAQQFIWIKAISQLSRRPYYLLRLYFETSHRKSKSDCLGGVAESLFQDLLTGKVPLWETLWNFINSATVLLTIAVSFLLNQKTLKILGSQLQNVHIKRFSECKSSIKLKIDIQYCLEYMLEIIYALAYPKEISISKIFRQTLQLLSGQVLK